MSADGRKRAPAGASHSQVSLAQKVDNYRRNHLRNLVSSFRRLAATPFQSIMTVLVIAIAMALPAALYVGVYNIERLGSGIEVSARMSVFLNPAATKDMIDTMMVEVDARSDVESVVFISADQALEEFRKASGFGDSLDTLDANPLPPAFQITPMRELIGDQAALKALVAWLEEKDIVDEVSLDLAWLQKLHALVEAGRQVVYGLGFVLAFGVLLVMGNTIRMAIESRRDEIVVVKLIGGTNGYVRRPFLYSGVWYGLLAGLLAWFLVWVGYLSLTGEVERLAKLYQSDFVLAGPGFSIWLILVFCGGLLGLLGAWVAVFGHLKTIEPE
jgi:cell division transport system permease protein